MSLPILITSAGTIHQAGLEVRSAPDMARQLEPVLGGRAVLIGLGVL